MAVADVDQASWKTYLSTLRLKNFRCFQDTGPIPFRPLTVLIGENNSGKSTLIDAILLAKQTVGGNSIESGLVTAGEEVDLGGFFDIVRGGFKSREREFSITLGMDWEGEVPFHLFWGDKNPKSGKMTFETRFGFDAEMGLPMTLSSTILQDGVKVAEIVKEGKTAKVTDPPISDTKGLEIHLDGFLPFVHFIAPPKGDHKNDTIVKLANSLMMHYVGWSNFFGGVKQIRPLRGPIPRYHILGRIQSTGMGAEGEALLRTLRSRVPVQRHSYPLIDALNDWMANRLGMVKKVSLDMIDKEGGAVASLVADEKKGVDGVNMANMGEGLSQILPVLSKVLGADYDDCVIVQQPEIHLHPALQAELGDLFIENLVGGNVHQIIVETHSEHLLLRLRRRVAEKKLTPDMVAVLYVERVGDWSQIRRLNLGADGHFDFWPEGFFEQDVEEAYQLSKASHPAGGS